MTIDWWTLGIQTVNVVILIWLLGRFFWRPVAAMIEQRRATAQRIVTEAEAKRSEATAALAEIERTRAGFARERDAILAAAHEAAERERTTRLAEAEKEVRSLEAAARATSKRSTKPGQTVPAGLRSISPGALPRAWIVPRCVPHSSTGFSRKFRLSRTWPGKLRRRREQRWKRPVRQRCCQPTKIATGNSLARRSGPIRKSYSRRTAPLSPAWSCKGLISS
jgi:F0F1-type ATP synthase membrane subunit b/b'